MKVTTTKSWEATGSDPATLSRLKKLVSAGEGEMLEFKQKASFPDKIVREMVAFANTKGGSLLVGVTDNGELCGLKYPLEDSFVIKKAIRHYIRPWLYYRETIIPISNKRSLLIYEIPQSTRRPHTMVYNRRKRISFVRVADRSIQASYEVREIVRQSGQLTDTCIQYGDSEQILFRYLDNNETITLNKFAEIARLEPFLASRKLVLLVLANILTITPGEKGDLYSLTIAG